jgi:PST family polysaccharide transporter
VQARSARVAQGVAWNIAYQAVEALLFFAATATLARLIAPEQYGRFSALLGIMAVPTALGCGGLIAQALQLPEGEEPDWSTHFGVALYVQLALALSLIGVAAIVTSVEAYASLAPLMRLAAIGVVLECPAQLRSTMLRRNLDFRRLRILGAIGVVLSVGSSLVLAARGAGASALVVGLSIATPIPPAVDLIVCGWRPRRRWWRPNLRGYRPAIHFGLRQAGSWLLHNLRETAASAVLPRTVGFPAMGLLNRAGALFSSTANRVFSALLEAVYPLLPRLTAETGAYARGATLFVQAVAWTLFPIILLLGLEGARLSHLLFGNRWSGIEPLIVPGALAMLARVIIVTGSSVLLGANRLRLSLILDAATSIISTPMLLVAWAAGLVAYAWALAIAQLGCAALFLVVAGRLLAPRWARTVLLPAGTACVIGYGVAWSTARALAQASDLLFLTAVSTVFGVAVVAVMRLWFPRSMSELLVHVPAGRRLSRWLRLA